MTVCRYFLKGTCRYGDRCRFDHPDNSYDSYKNYGQERYGSNETINHQQYDRNKYDSRSYDGGSGYYRTESPQSYGGGPGYYRTESPQRYGGGNGYYRTESPQRYGDGSGYYRTESPQRYAAGTYSKERYNASDRNNYYGNKQQNYTVKNSSNTRNENAYGNNRYKWLAEDHKKQTPQKTVGDPHKNDVYSTSTPKAKVNFSFKVPESEIKKKDSSQYKVGALDEIRANTVKEDANSWELSGQWPFTCYGLSDKGTFPGFFDLSPEELRYAAYKAEENNSFNSYVEFVKAAVMQINQKRSELKVPTPQLLDTLRRIHNGEVLDNTSNFPMSLPFLEHIDARNNTLTSKTAGNNAAASFSFNAPTDVADSVKKSASTFSFKTSDPVSAKAPGLMTSNGDVEIYTPLENLTDDEKEQFIASTFVLGKIPTKPPPQVYCK